MKKISILLSVKGETIIFTSGSSLDKMDNVITFY